ncbi:hypothetical protein ACFXC8_50235 [Streptomyces sp. NPDC059441]|uniref:hypothetical protein n=1 Tax=Streptomyces sp. NPDC059441 TaxID=3346829 RepID=UPI0036CDC4B2
MGNRPCLLGTGDEDFVVQTATTAHVLVSADPGQQEIRLIDADDLGLVSAVESAPVHTPVYGAPEIVAGAAGPPRWLTRTHSAC